MKNSIIETLFQNYRAHQDNKDLQVLNEEFVKILEELEEDQRITSELLDLSHSINLLSSKLSFEAGFKYGVQAVKECGLI